LLYRRRPTPEDTEASAQWVIDDLKADRYNVEINWLTAMTPNRCRYAR